METQEIDIMGFYSVPQYKIVYWGPGESGKSSTFEVLCNRYNYWGVMPRAIKMETAGGRTLWEDDTLFNVFFKNIFFRVNTCTGQLRFKPTREYVLSTADCVIFVADSDPKKMQQNKRSFGELLEYKALEVPVLFQLNKRDIPNAIPLRQFKLSLGLPVQDHYENGVPVVFETYATSNREEILNDEDLPDDLLSHRKNIYYCFIEALKQTVIYSKRFAGKVFKERLSQYSSDELERYEKNLLYYIDNFDEIIESGKEFEFEVKTGFRDLSRASWALSVVREVREVRKRERLEG